MRFKFYLIMLAVSLLFPRQALAQTEGDLADFSSVAPDALIILDQSENMKLAAPAKMYISSTEACGADIAYYGSLDSIHTQACIINPSGSIPKFSNPACSGPFYQTPRTGYDTDCSRLALAKRAIFSILDDNKSGAINSQDEGSLGIRFGYMRFTGCTAHEEDGFGSGCNRNISALGSKYSSIYTSISSASASGKNLLVDSLVEAKLYLDYSKANDRTSCRSKFAILITSSMDTLSCNGNGADNQQDMYKRRRDSVRKAKELADAGYKLFVLAIGSNLPRNLINTYNWMAYYGLTDNPIDTNTGVTTAFNPSLYGNCAAESVLKNDSEGYFLATSGDPGDADIAISGYAFISTTQDSLTTNLSKIATVIRESTFSFSQISVQSTRTQDENFLYEGSFQMVSNDPFWLGHLKKYALEPDGTVGAQVWDAGNRLQAMDSANRNIKTYLGGSLVDFTSSNVTPDNLGITTTDITEQERQTRRTRVVEFIRGNPAIDPTTSNPELPYNSEYWKLGDVFRSTPITVGTPSAFFYDQKDENNAFTQFRAAHSRTSDNNKRIILTGANDGQMHAFHTSTGDEAWSFIPPNLLSRLQYIAHEPHPTNLSHLFFVDGPIGIADVWLGSGSYTAKSPADWKTIMVISEGRGGSETLWSSSPGCGSGFSKLYDSGHPYYCGYFALDITETLSPQYKWSRINYTQSSSPEPDSDARNYLGEPWSKMMIGKVWRDGVEKWVGFMGGGYNGANCAGGGSCDAKPGKAFFIIDIGTGEVLWSYTKFNDSNMVYSLPANPAIVDSDNDGFIDTVYIGDLGGNMWRFKLCLGTEPYCTWSGGRLFQSNTASGIRPVYTSAAVARDPYFNLWVYWGTGDKTDPTAANAQEKLYAVKDNDRTTTRTLSDLQDISRSTYSETAKPAGWYIEFAGQGEKMLGDPTIFGGVIYLTTYTPSQSTDPCSQAGSASLYAMNYTSGSGILSGGTRRMDLGSGIPSPPIVSMKPGNTAGADLYVTTSGGSGTGASTRRANLEPPGVANRTNVLFWRDKRVQ